jgi:hypothetical protein
MQNIDKAVNDLLGEAKSEVKVKTHKFVCTVELGITTSGDKDYALGVVEEMIAQDLEALDRGNDQGISVISHDIKSVGETDESINKAVDQLLNEKK